MKNALAIAAREIRSYFVSPVAYVVLTGFLLLSGWFFFNLLARFSYLLQIYGSAGRVMMGYPRNELSVVRADGTPVPGYSREELTSHFDARDLLAPFRALAQNFADAIDGRAAATPNGVDGLRAVEVIDACYRSSRSGRRIDLPLEEP